MRQIPAAQAQYSFEEASYELPLLRKARRKESRKMRKKLRISCLGWNLNTPSKEKKTRYQAWKLPYHRDYRRSEGKPNTGQQKEHALLTAEGKLKRKQEEIIASVEELSKEGEITKLYQPCSSILLLGFNEQKYFNRPANGENNMQAKRPRWRWRGKLRRILTKQQESHWNIPQSIEPYLTPRTP
ncbi:hypothetical protein Acr_07g0013640 [Actinidia rufa]|uniref:Uncharacterized protein n=1 Tax=Actinidia rufa TaxID=165716 RepID=A0A7J0EXM5_9ERIC|nr:hypothetical protein Acr_07g0013640 [Actinidia rufa]